MRRLHALLIAASLAAAPTTTALADTASQGRLGVMVMTLTPELRTHYGASADRGVLIGRVEPGSAAATAGIAVGDVLVDVRGTPVDDAADVVAALAASKAGDPVTVTVLRNKQRLSLTAKPTASPLSKLVFPKLPWLEELMTKRS